MNVEFPSEKAIEDYVESKILKDRICPISGDEVDELIRQHPIEGYGAADIVKMSFGPQVVVITVLELKKETLKEAHLSQLARYMRGIERQATGYMKKVRGLEVYVQGELAGPFDPAANDLCFLSERLDDIDIFQVELSMDHGFAARPIGSGWYKAAESRMQGRALARIAYPHLRAIQDAEDAIFSAKRGENET